MAHRQDSGTKKPTIQWKEESSVLQNEATHRREEIFFRYNSADDDQKKLHEWTTKKNWAEQQQAVYEFDNKW